MILPEEEKVYPKATNKTCVNISPEFYQQAKKLNIKFTEALRVGLALLFAERGLMEYDNNLLITRKRNQLITQIQDLAQEIEELKQKNAQTKHQGMS